MRAELNCVKWRDLEPWQEESCKQNLHDGIWIFTVPSLLCLLPLCLLRFCIYLWDYWMLLSSLSL